jgi:MFS transporter, DHA3 family, macrolide efflux protein
MTTTQDISQEIPQDVSQDIPINATPDLHSQTSLPKAEEKRTLWSPSFVALWLGQLICFTGNNVYSLALMWEMKVLTGSTVMMSTVSIATLVPMILIGPIAGALVDRWPKRMAMISSDIVRAITIAVLTVVLAAGHLAPWMLIVGAALNSTVGAFYTPANSAVMPLLVGRENLQRANSLAQGTAVITGMIGPFLGGFLVAHVSMTAAFLANALAYLASVVSLLFVRPNEAAKKKTKSGVKQLVVEMKEGLDVIRNIGLVRKLFPVALIANFLFAPFDLILIQFSTNTLHGSAQLYGTIGTCFSAGMLIGAVTAGFAAKKVKKGHVITGTFLLMSLSMVAMSFSRSIWLVLVLAGLMGMFNLAMNITLMTIIQTQIPQDKMGRVFGAMGTLAQGAQPFSQAFAGVLLGAFATPVLMLFIGILSTADAVYAATRREIRQQA